MGPCDRRTELPVVSLCAWLRREGRPIRGDAVALQALLYFDRTDERAVPALQSLQLVVQLGSFRTGQREVRDEGYATRVRFEQVESAWSTGPGHHDTKA